MIGVLLLVATVATCYGEPIRCTLSKSQYCYLDRSIKRFSSSPQEPAPLPDSLTTKPSSNGNNIHMEWKQRKSQLQDVKAYSVEVTAAAMDGSDDYIFAINQSQILETVQDNENFITFTFDDAFFVPMSTIITTLYALPLYNPNDKDYYRMDKIDPNQPKPVEPVAPPTTTTTTTTTKTTTTSTTKPCCIPCINIGTMSTKPMLIESTKSYEDPDNTVMMAGIVITSNIITASLILSCAIAWKRCQWKKVKSSEPENLALLMDGTQRGSQASSSRQPILVLTNKEEKDAEGSNSDYYKRIALCLTNTLQSAKEFDVSCNLWMTESISERGIAIWAHDVMKANNKVIILCNSDEAETSSYTLLIQNLVKSTEFDGAKFLIICMEDRPSHKCFTKMDIQALQTCTHLKIKRDLNDLVKALRPEGLERPKVDGMNNIFAQMMAKMQVNQTTHGYRHDIKQHSPMCEVIFKNESACEQLVADGQSGCLKRTEPHKKRRREFSDSTSEGKTATQYDSFYSSRCNSQSSETLSSGEDTGYSEHPRRNCSPEKSTGARPKQRAIIQT